MRNKQQVADDIVKAYAVVKTADSDTVATEVAALFKLLDEFTQVMQAYNRGKPDIDAMRAKAAQESARRQLLSRSVYAHNHSYKAVTAARRQYKCTKDDCPHIIAATQLLGRAAECPNCKEKVVVTEDHLRRMYITCIGCGRQKFMPNLPGSTNTQLDVKGLLSKMKFIKQAKPVPRGGKVGETHRVRGNLMGTCGNCPCCISRKLYTRNKNYTSYQRRKRSDSISDEELERRILAKPLR